MSDIIKRIEELEIKERMLSQIHTTLYVNFEARKHPVEIIFTENEDTGMRVYKALRILSEKLLYAELNRDKYKAIAMELAQIYGKCENWVFSSDEEEKGYPVKIHHNEFSPEDSNETHKVESYGAMVPVFPSGKLARAKLKELNEMGEE